MKSSINFKITKTPKLLSYKTFMFLACFMFIISACTKSEIEFDKKEHVTSLKAGATAQVSAIFGGGPFFSGGWNVINEVKASGFNTVVIWCIHVNGSNGDLALNDKRIISNGNYVGENPDWQWQLSTLKNGSTSVNRIEVSIGSWGVPDFQSIRNLIASQGTGPSSILYRNFKKLKEITGADAANLDDEDLYDANTSITFGNMLYNIGYMVTLCPYTNSWYWSSVKNGLGNKVDRVYLQCYDGGGNNVPNADWTFGGLTPIPGLWGGGSHMSASTIQNVLSSWRNSYGITGGFIWLYDDIQGSASQYASAINNALGDNTSGYFRIVNRWTGDYMHNESRNNWVELTANPGGWHSAQWYTEPTDGGYFRIRNRWTGAYINIENTYGWVQLSSTPLSGGWFSGQWSKEYTENGWFRLKNRWKSDRYMHVENRYGWVQEGGIQPGWFSAQWWFEPAN